MVFPDNTVIMFGKASGTLSPYAKVGGSSSFLNGYYINSLRYPLTFKTSPIKVCQWSIGTGFAWDGAGIGTGLSSASIYGVATISDNNATIQVNIVVFGVKA